MLLIRVKSLRRRLCGLQWSPGAQDGKDSLVLKEGV